MSMADNSVMVCFWNTSDAK